MYYEYSVNYDAAIEVYNKLMKELAFQQRLLVRFMSRDWKLPANGFSIAIPNCLRQNIGIGASIDYARSTLASICLALIGTSCGGGGGQGKI